MGKVVYDMSMSLEGFVTAAGITPEEPLLASVGNACTTGPLTLGAVRCWRGSFSARARSSPDGQRTTNHCRGWGPDGPTGEARVPLFVLTHCGSPPPPAGSVYTFVTDGVDSAVRHAKAGS